MFIDRLKKLGNRGDTIVEVMIVLAVLGLAIGISYATANSSLLATKGAQENSQATAILQSQIESLRYIISDPANDVQIAGPYCIDDSYDIKVTNDASPSPDCRKNNLYDVGIKYDTSTSTFSLKATWDDINGKDKDTVTLVYRLYK